MHFIYLYGRDEGMKIIYDENEHMNHHELKLVYHPKNKKLAQLLLKQFTENLGEVELYDEYHNKYYIPLLAIYYFEMIDQKFYAYTEKDVYRISCMKMELLKKRVQDYGFYQINVRTLVNIKHVKTYKIQRGSRRRIVLDNDDILISSRHYKPEFDRLADHLKIEKIHI